MKWKTVANVANISLTIAFATNLIPNICSWIAGETTTYKDSVFLCIFVILWNIRDLIDRHK